MRKRFFLSIFLPLLMLLAVPLAVFADGGIFINYERSIYIPAQKAAIGWDKDAGEETLVLSTQIKIENFISEQNFADVAWVIPIPSSSEPTVEEGSIDIFYGLARLFSGAARWSLDGLLGKGECGDGCVEVVAAKEIDIYDVTILRATDAAALVDWLNDNGYVTPESAVTVLEEYCAQENFYFIANKIDLTNKYQDLVVTGADRTCALEIGESVYPYTEISSGLVDYLMSEADSCSGAALEAVQTLVELDRGVATPLKITFSPEAPFYPLKISSINEGETVVDVYVFSDTPVTDGSQVLTLMHMTENTESFDEAYGFGQKYVTYLSYFGDLEALGDDAWFGTTDYSHGSDPNYISLSERAIGLLSTVMSFVLYFSYPAAFIVFFLFSVVGVVVTLKAITKTIRKRICRRRSRRSSEPR